MKFSGFKIIFCFLTLSWVGIKAQGGYRTSNMEFVVNNGSSNLKLLWSTDKIQWQFAEKNETEFAIKKFARSMEQQIHLKIFEKGNRDTMFIVTDKSLASIDFLVGSYDLTGAAGYLFNITTYRDTKITNKNWSSAVAQNNGLPLLNKTRHVYLQRSHYPHEMNEKDVQYASFKNSVQFKVGNNEDHEEWLTLGKIYHNPKLSNSFYCLANYYRTEDAPSDFEYYWLLESTDGLQSWQKKFPLKHNVLELLNYSAVDFTFATFNEKDEIVKYNATGQVLSATGFEGGHCGLDQNQFYNCDTHIYPFSDGSKSISSPIYQSENSVHSYHTNFIWGDRNILLTDLPFKPGQLKWYDNVSSELYAELDLATNETYVYLTHRKNKLVLMSYHYTMTSVDFGKTWTFYANGIIAGSDWNVVWLDDNRLASITNYYTDIVQIF